MCSNPIKFTARTLFSAALLICACMLLINGRAISTPVGPEAKQLEAVADEPIPYRSEWKRHFSLQTDLVPEGVSDDTGTLWLKVHYPHTFKDFLVRIDASGTLVDTIRPQFPLRPIERVAYLSPAVSAGQVGLLASLASGGKDETFEGALFAPISANGLGAPVRVAGRGPQFPTLVGTGDGRFIAAGDQEPLTIIKLDGSGTILWKRSFSRHLVLPTVSVGDAGTIFVLSQAGHGLVLQVLNADGQLVKSRRIAAAQGTVLSDPSGGCTLLCSRQCNGAENVVYLIRLDAELQQIAEVKTPLVGLGGRDYVLHRSPHGYLVIGRCCIDRDRRWVSPSMVAEFDDSGKLLWQHLLRSTGSPLLVPFRAGFYLVQDAATNGEGIDIERYLY